MIKAEEIITVGKFQKTHALKGELNMILDIDPNYFLEGNPLIINNEGILVPYYVDTIREKGATSYLIKLDGIDTEDEASHFVNKEIGIIKKGAEEWLDEDSWAYESLIDFTVLDFTSGEKLGIIKDIDTSTINHLFILQKENGEETYIPVSEDLIEEINDEEKLIKMILPEGLADINS